MIHAHRTWNWKCKLRNFTSSFFIRMPVTSCLIALARISHTMLNGSGESEYCCIIYDPRRESFSLYHWVWCLLWACITWPLLCWDTFVLYLVCWMFFIVNECWTLSDTFSASIGMLMYFILRFVIVVYHIYCFGYVDPSLHPKDESICSWHIILLLGCWIRLANLFLRIFVSVFIRDTGL